jgi:hypothetical protein
MVTNTQSGTNVHEIAEGIYRINTPGSIPGGPGSFSFNQYLIVDDQPLLFHTGPRRMFPLVREAVGRVLPLERLAYIGLSHYEVLAVDGPPADRTRAGHGLPRDRALAAPPGEVTSQRRHALTR